MSAPATDRVCKVILLGNGSVGKSSIIARFVADGFQRQYKQTIGVEFFEKRVYLRGDKAMLLQVWDIGGQSFGSKMLGPYVFRSDGVFLCYDITDADSFQDVSNWLEFVQRSVSAGVAGAGARTAAMPKLYLLGNKVDLVHLRRVSEEEHAQFIERHGLAGGFFVSARNGDRVMRMFYQAAGEIAGAPLSSFELSYADKVVAVALPPTGSEREDARTDCADDIEREDLELERRRQQLSQQGQGCCALQ